MQAARGCTPAACSDYNPITYANSQYHNLGIFVGPAPSIQRKKEKAGEQPCRSHTIAPQALFPNARPLRHIWTPKTGVLSSGGTRGPPRFLPRLASQGSDDCGPSRIASRRAVRLQSPEPTRCRRADSFTLARSLVPRPSPLVHRPSSPFCPLPPPRTDPFQMQAFAVIPRLAPPLTLTRSSSGSEPYPPPPPTKRVARSRAIPMLLLHVRP
jgi:hypothetical protein